jgi:hypothetical protein
VTDFDNAQYGPVCQALLSDPPSAALGPGEPNHNCRQQLEQLNAAAVFSGSSIVDHDMAACCRAGLWLLHNYLDESHRISQEIHTPTGSYWHGIMHRREPDFSNAKYWFRKVGDHPIFASLTAGARQIAAAQLENPAATFLAEQDNWNAAAFVDLCEAASQGRSGSPQLCQAVALAEWQFLFDYCFQAAIGE